VNVQKNAARAWVEMESHLYKTSHRAGDIADMGVGPNKLAHESANDMLQSKQPKDRHLKTATKRHEEERTGNKSTTPAFTACSAIAKTNVIVVCDGENK
jgi:hypothetical protein